MSKILDIKKRIVQKRKERKKCQREEADNQPIIIRDAREKEFFIVDDVYFNGYARVCGPQASVVYMVLCRHAGSDQTCFPGIDLIASKTGMAKKSVVGGLRTLEDHKIIFIDREKGKSNIYTLLNKRKWRKFIVTGNRVEGRKATEDSKAAFIELNKGQFEEGGEG